MKAEISDVNYTIANLNREKVNLMREMTIINDKSMQNEKESIKYKELY